MDWSPPVPYLRQADLIDPVRRAKRSESVIPTDWRLDPLGGGRGEITGGVYRVVGRGQDQGHPVSWSLVLKVVPEPDLDEDPAAYNYWKREFRIYQAGLVASLPGITAPLCWGACDRPGDGTWLWLEDVEGPRGTWRDHDYAHAARNLGQFSAAYLKKRPLPRAAWLSDRMLRKGCAFFGPYMRDLRATLDHPLVRQFCSAEQATRLERLWTAREALLQKVEDLPLSKPGARYQDYSRPVSPDFSPNPPCVSQRNGLSTVSVVRLLSAESREWGSWCRGSGTG